jgi:hypothetical protein
MKRVFVATFVLGFAAGLWGIASAGLFPWFHESLPAPPTDVMTQSDSDEAVAPHANDEKNDGAPQNPL